MTTATIWAGPVGGYPVVDADLATLLAIASTLRFQTKTYSQSVNFSVGNALLLGQKDTILSIPSLVMNTGLDFYSWGLRDFTVSGAVYGAATNGIYQSKAHRGAIRDVLSTGFFQGYLAENCYVNSYDNFRVENSTYGASWTLNSNACLVMGGGFVHNTNHGAYVSGSYSFTFFGGDSENNTNGIILSNNVQVGAAESRSNRIIAWYFETNATRDIWIGDQLGAATVRNSVMAWNYHTSNCGVAVDIDHSDSALLFFPHFVGVNTARVALRANSLTTRYIPFPRYDLATAAEVFVEAGATVDEVTQQRGYNEAVIVLDGAGNGTVDITFRAPYNFGFPNIHVQFYSITDLATAPTPYRVNPLPTKVDFKTGFRLRVIGGTAGATVRAWWRVGGL